MLPKISINLCVLKKNMKIFFLTQFQQKQGHSRPFLLYRKWSLSQKKNNYMLWNICITSFSGILSSLHLRIKGDTFVFFACNSLDKEEEFKVIHSGWWKDSFFELGVGYLNSPSTMSLCTFTLFRVFYSYLLTSLNGTTWRRLIC